MPNDREVLMGRVERLERDNLRFNRLGIVALIPTCRISCATALHLRLVRHGHDLLHRKALPLHGESPFLRY